MKTLADRIKSLRMQGETQSQFAARLGTTQASISRYINGRQPDRETLIKIAHQTGVSLDWLLTGQTGDGADTKSDGQLLQAAIAYLGDLAVLGKDKARFQAFVRDLVDNKELRRELLTLWENSRKK